MNSVTTRQQSNQRKVRVAAREGRNNTSARAFPTRRQTINSLVRRLETNPSQKEWSEAVDSVLLVRWPNIMTMSSSEQQSALAKFFAIVEEARAIVRAKLSPKQLLLNHQAAVNSLLELSVGADAPDESVAVPFDKVPGLFRFAIEQDKAAGGRNPYPEETDLIEYALMLIDRNGGDTTIRTPEQEQFYADLAFRFEDEQFRVAYSPENVTVH
jgi:hypothetical protein